MYHVSCKNMFWWTQVDPLSGLLAVAHEKGDVRLYQYSLVAQQVLRYDFSDAAAAPEVGAVQQPAGFQCILHSTLHSATVTALLLAPRLRVLAAADEEGNETVIELCKVCPGHGSGSIAARTTWRCALM